ncbi:hypothetical protein ACROYT_G033131 [Oculina patagonica]
MKILTWNINGIRAAGRGRSLKDILDSLEADVICLQETKVTRDMLDEVTAIVDGYNAYFSFSKVKTGYSGVATFCRNEVTPIAAEEGLSAVLTPQPSIGSYGSNTDFTPEELEALDAEGRAILTEHRLVDDKSVVIINVYCPRADKENKDRVDFKLKFYKLLQERAEAIVKEGRHVIVLGDINTAHKMIDHCEPDKEELFDANPGRQWLNQFLVPGEVSSTKPAEETNDLLETQGGLFIDTFRYFHPTQRSAYTNWCTVTSARQTNYGTRIDYIFADVELVRKELINCEIKADIEGSDHCPVVATLRNTFQAALKPPALCTKYMPEFAGRQQKLKSYFAKHAQQVQRKPQSQPETSQEVKTSLKRSASYDDDKAKSVKRQKSAGVKSKADSQAKTNLLSFFSRSSNLAASDKTVSEVRRTTDDLDKAVSETLGANTSKDSLGLNSDDSASENTTSLTGDKAVSDSNKECPEKRKVEVALWKSILTGPRPPPLCSGHKEPCVLRTVKAKGPNQGRQFHCCARPQGHSSNPQARCNFFKWVK